MVGQIQPSSVKAIRRMTASVSHDLQRGSTCRNAIRRKGVSIVRHSRFTEETILTDADGLQVEFHVNVDVTCQGCPHITT